MLAPLHIAYVGGHWKQDDATARALFDFKAGIFGSEGRMTIENFSTMGQTYNAHIKPKMANQQGLNYQTCE